MEIFLKNFGMTYLIMLFLSNSIEHAFDNKMKRRKNKNEMFLP